MGSEVKHTCAYCGFESANPVCSDWARGSELDDEAFVVCASLSNKFGWIKDDVRRVIANDRATPPVPVEESGVDPDGYYRHGDAVYMPNHYTKWKIEPIDFIMQNKLPFADGNVIKYVMRHRDKNGLEDLRKAKRYIDMIIEREYPDAVVPK